MSKTRRPRRERLDWWLFGLTAARHGTLRNSPKSGAPDPPITDAARVTLSHVFERTPLMGRDVVGRVALDLVLRIV